MSTIYLGTIDGGGDGKVLLLAAINQKLGSNYSLSDFQFGVPEAVAVPTPTHNTKIKFGPLLAAGFYGVRTIYYSRIHASSLGNVVVPYAGEGYLIQLLDKINEKYGVLITEADVVNAPVLPPASGESNVKVTLEFKPESIVYYSSTLIQVGLNDPTGDTTPIVPFENYATFSFDQSQQYTLRGTNYSGIEPFSLALGRDNSTMRLATLASATQGNGVAAHARVRLTKEAYDLRRAQLPFVGQWVDSVTGKARGVSVLGDVYELATNGYDWTLLGNGLGLSTSDAAIATNGYANPYVKFAVQAENGTVYVLAKKPSEAPAVWSVSASTGVWTKMGFSASRMQCLTTATWNELQVLDFLHANNRLWVLIRTNTQYDVHPTKGRLTPSVEMYNTSILSTDYFPLGASAMRFSNIGLNTTTGKWRLVTPPTASTATHCDVVALVSSTTSNNTYAVIYRHQTTGEYLGYILPNSLLPNSNEGLAELDIAAYQIDLTTTTATLAGSPVVGQYLDVVSILSPVEVDNFNRYFLRTENRGPQKYLAYGLRTLTSVAVRNARTAWKETQISLPSANKPTLVTLYGAGKRNHVIFQNGTAIHKPLFNQLVGTSEFEMRLDSTIALESHTGFDGCSHIGSGVYVRPGVAEFATPTAALAAIQDDEATLAPIGFSFIARATDGTRGWYTAQNAGDLLTLRTPSFNYAFMGKVPACVITEGNRILYWSREGNGLFISTNQGLSWQEFNAAPVFYRQEAAASSALNVLGSAVLRLTTENFGEAVFMGTKVLIETNCTEEVKTYDVNGGGYNASRTLADHMLFEVGPGANGNVYLASGNQSGFGLNALSQYSPRKILAWDSDATGTYETVGQYSTSAATPYNTSWRVTDYMYNTPGRLVDFSRDVRYLNVRHWFLVEDNNVWNLHFTDAVTPTRTVGLFGVSGSPYSTFKPEANFHLWDYLDEVAGYVPYVFYGGGRVLLLERVDQSNNFAVTHHVLSVPNDNGQPLKLVKMYTANRRDYWFHQKGNGLFKMAYTWDGINSVSTVSLSRVFDMSSVSLSSLDVYSGALAGIVAKNAPQEATLPDALPNGYEIGHHCDGTTRVVRYANGTGGFYEVGTPRSIECGYVVTSSVGPSQGTTGESIS